MRYNLSSSCCTCRIIQNEDTDCRFHHADEFEREQMGEQHGAQSAEHATLVMGVLNLVGVWEFQLHGSSPFRFARPQERIVGSVLRWYRIAIDGCQGQRGPWRSHILSSHSRGE